MSDSFRPHGLQQARPPCPSPTPRVYSNSCPLSRWCHPTISSSVVPFSSCLKSFPASGSFPWVSSLHQVAKVLEFQPQSFQWIFRADFLCISRFYHFCIYSKHLMKYCKNPSRFGWRSHQVFILIVFGNLIPPNWEYKVIEDPGLSRPPLKRSYRWGSEISWGLVDPQVSVLGKSNGGWLEYK